MALDFTAIRTTVINSIKLSIGDQLSQTYNPDLDVEYGTVLNARPNPEKAIPDYPYAVLDITGSSDTDWYLTAQRYDEITDDWQYETSKTLDLQITIYGGNAIQIAEELKTSYRRDDMISLLRAGGIGIGDVQQVQILPELLQTDFLEVAFVQLTIRVTDTYVDESLESIENVVLDGELDCTLSGNPINIFIDTSDNT